MYVKHFYLICYLINNLDRPVLKEFTCPTIVLRFWYGLPLELNRSIAAYKFFQAGPVQPSNSLHKKRTSGKAGLNSPLKDRNAKQRRSDLAEKIDSVYLVSDDLNDCDNFDFVSPNIKPQNFSLRDSEHSDNVAGKYIKPKPLLSRVAPKRRKKPCLEEWKLVSFQRGTEQHQPAVMKFNNEDQGFKIQIDDEEKPQLGFSLQWIRSVIVN
jgi:hypothetical protein